MKAMLCTAYGPPDSLTLTDVPSAPLGEHDLRIGVHAAGVNFPDLLIIQGLYQVKPDLPFAPGGEAAGVVLEVGPSVTGFTVGDRVLGMTRWNGFAEEAVVPAHRCVRIPAAVDLTVAAGISLTYGTQIIATGGSDTKLRAVGRHYGVDALINYNTDPEWKDQVKALTEGRGADVICDPVGGDVFEKSLRCINWEGRLLVVGFTSGTIPKARANLVLLKGCSVVGVFWGAYADKDPDGNRANFAQLFSWLEEGRLRPLIARRFPLADAVEALKMIERREVVGKIILTTDRHAD